MNKLLLLVGTAFVLVGLVYALVGWDARQYWTGTQYCDVVAGGYLYNGECVK